MSEKHKLKPCSLCGGEAIYLTDGIKFSTVICLKCGEELCIKGENSLEEAIELWNNRAANCGMYVQTAAGWKPAPMIEYSPPKWYLRPFVWLIDMLRGER